MKQMKAVLLTLISATFAFGLAACSGGTSSAPAAAGTNSTGTNSTGASPADAKPADSKPAASSGEKVTISFDWWGAGARNDKYNSIADLYEKSHPNVKIERQFSDFNPYWDKLNTQVAGGNAPDVIGMHATFVGDYARRGALLELDPYLQDGTIDVSNFPKSVQDVGKVNGKTVMVAQGVTMTGWEYNHAAFDKLGVKYPDFNWTWDDFTAKVEELQKAINASDDKSRWASTDNSTEITSLEVFARQRGKEVFTPEGKLGINKDDMVAWFSIWDKLRKEKAIPDAATTQQYMNVTLDQGLFVKGKLLLTQFPFNQIPLYQTYIKDGEVRGLRHPTDPKGKEGEFVEGAYLSVTKTSKHPKEAADFINFFVNNPDVQTIFKLEQGALGSTKGNDLIKSQLQPAEQRTIDAIQTALKTAGQLPLPPAGQGEVRSLLVDTAQSIAFGKSTIDQAAQSFVDKAAAILSK